MSNSENVNSHPPYLLCINKLRTESDYCCSLSSCRIFLQNFISLSKSENEGLKCFLICGIGCLSSLFYIASSKPRSETYQYHQTTNIWSQTTECNVMWTVNVMGPLDDHSWQKNASFQATTNLICDLWAQA